MKIIDFEKNGNQVKFFVGSDECTKYYGDDWDDTPYEHNAGRVYDNFILGWFVKTFDFDDIVMEPCDGHDNSSFCKDDMRNRKVPCIVVLPKKYVDENGWYYYFEDISGNINAIRFYFGDKVENEDIHFVKNIGEEEKYVSFRFENLTYEEEKVVRMASDLLSITAKYSTHTMYLDSPIEKYEESCKDLYKNINKLMINYLKMASKTLNIPFDKKIIFNKNVDLREKQYPLTVVICCISDDNFKIGKLQILKR